MTEYVTGLFIAAGNCPPEEQVDPLEDLARVLIVMPKSTLRDVERLPMYEEVTVIPTAELTALRAENARLVDGILNFPRAIADELEMRATFKANQATTEVTTKHTKDTKGETG